MNLEVGKLRVSRQIQRIRDGSSGAGDGKAALRHLERGERQEHRLALRGWARRPAPRRILHYGLPKIPPFRNFPRIDTPTLPVIGPLLRPPGLQHPRVHLTVSRPEAARLQELFPPPACYLPAACRQLAQPAHAYP